MVKCFDCENFENRCYTNGSVISVCNKRHEVVDPEDTCKRREKLLEQWKKKVGWYREAVE